MVENPVWKIKLEKKRINVKFKIIKISYKLKAKIKIDTGLNNII